MKKFNLSVILILFINLLNAQKEGNIWYFGQKAGLDFNSGSPVARTDGGLNTYEGCSSICDAAGNLLFYTDGVSVWNRNHVVMLNGMGLSGNNTSTQSAMIIKQPGTQNIYYIFSLYDHYCYSIVDMTLNGGLGNVTSSKNVIIKSNIGSEKQCATPHVNATDVWIMTRDKNTFYAYLLTTSGFNIVPILSTVSLSSISPIGQMKFSRRGNKIAYGIFSNPISLNICLSDFDNGTGIVSNSISFPNGEMQSYGVEFSPDESKLYVTGTTSKAIYQYNLKAGSTGAIIASQTQIGSGSFPIGALQIGPDKKIYIALEGAHFLGVINNPDSMGLACNYKDTAINLGPAISKGGLPELISDYYQPRLGLNNLESKNQFSLFPNPSKDYFFIRNDNFSHSFNAILYAVDGRKVLEALITSDFQKINISQLSKGIYFLEVSVDQERMVKKIVKE